MATKGDEVLYVPSEAHALDKGGNLPYAWSHAWQDERTGEVGEILTDEEVGQQIKYVKRMGQNGSNKRKHLVAIAPQVTWPAVVTAVNADGTCDLDIEYCLEGVTHSYKAIAEDATGKTPHTFHAKQA